MLNYQSIFVLPKNCPRFLNLFKGNSRLKATLSLYIYAIMKTMCPPGFHHNGFVATHALGLMMYGSWWCTKVYHCHKAIVVLTRIVWKYIYSYKIVDFYIFVEKLPNMLMWHDFLCGLPTTNGECKKYRKYDKNMLKDPSLLPLQDSYLLSLSQY